MDLTIIISHDNMSAPKFKQFVKLMYEKHAEVFADFKPLHDQFAVDQEKYADEFHSQGLKILDIARDWERRLCFGMGKGKYAAYSAKLADKFWEEIEKTYPLIRQVGLKIKMTSARGGSALGGK